MSTRMSLIVDEKEQQDGLQVHPTLETAIRSSLSVHHWVLFSINEALREMVKQSYFLRLVDVTAGVTRSKKGFQPRRTDILFFVNYVEERCVKEESIVYIV